MSTRWVLHLDGLDDIDTEPLLRRLAGEVADDAQRIVDGQSSGSGRLELAIQVTEVDDRHAIVEAAPRNPRSSPEHKPYAFWVEKGTSDTRAEPFLRPATYIYRMP